MESVADKIHLEQRTTSLYMAHTEGMIDADMGKPCNAHAHKDPELQGRYQLGYNKVLAMQQEPDEFNR